MSPATTADSPSPENRPFFLLKRCCVTDRQVPRGSDESNGALFFNTPKQMYSRFRVAVPTMTILAFPRSANRWPRASIATSAPNAESFFRSSLLSKSFVRDARRRSTICNYMLVQTVRWKFSPAGPLWFLSCMHHRFWERLWRPGATLQAPCVRTEPSSHSTYPHRLPCTTHMASHE